MFALARPYPGPRTAMAVARPSFGSAWFRLPAPMAPRYSAAAPAPAPLRPPSAETRISTSTLGSILPLLHPQMSALARPQSGPGPVLARVRPSFGSGAVWPRALFVALGLMTPSY